MLRHMVYIQVQAEATQRLEKAMEGHGTRWKLMETYGSLWKMREQSIDKYVSSGQSSPESRMEMEREMK